MSAEHEGEITTDPEGWTVASCSCGWVGPPCPGQSEALGFLSDHYAVAREVQHGG